MAEDPYRVLGVSKDSSDAEIKRTYRKLARQYHPDRNPNDTAAEERFKSIQTAYESIGSPEARREWDQQRRMEEMFRGGRSPSGSSRGFDFGDLFSQFVGGRSNANFGFDTESRQSRHSPFTDSNQREASSRGADIEAGLDVTLEQAIIGTEVNFSHRRMKRCQKCEGSSFGTARTCKDCSGTGVQTRGSSINVKVPPGAIHGQQLRLRGMGHEHPQGVPGDLLITLRLDAKEGRRWEDGRLIQEAPVPISTLILGGSVRITTPLGKRIQIEVPERTKIGDRRRVNGHGHQGGDLDIEFVLHENDNLTKKQIEILEQLREAGL